jgi:hypothetical protein
MIQRNKRIARILRGEENGIAFALREPKNGIPEALAAVLPADIGLLRVAEPCRAEHPHSAFLRKPVHHEGRAAIHTTLYAPDGKLQELRLTESSQIVEPFVKRSPDFKVLRSYLKDIDPIPLVYPRTAPYAALAGMSPQLELRARWSSADVAGSAAAAEDESFASCQRKLERLFRRRCEEAARQGCCCLELSDLRDAQVSVQTALQLSGSDREWLQRHVGVPLFYSLPVWEDSTAEALRSINIGLHIEERSLQALAGMGGYEGRLLIDLPLFNLRINEVVFDAICRCSQAVVLFDCPLEGELSEFVVLLKGLLSRITGKVY